MRYGCGRGGGPSARGDPGDDGGLPPGLCPPSRPMAPLAVDVVPAAELAFLVTAASLSQAGSTRRGGALSRAVPVAPVAGPADPHHDPAAPAKETAQRPVPPRRDPALPTGGARHGGSKRPKSPPEDLTIPVCGGSGSRLLQRFDPAPPGLSRRAPSIRAPLLPTSSVQPQAPRRRHAPGPLPAGRESEGQRLPLPRNHKEEPDRRALRCGLRSRKSAQLRSRSQDPAARGGGRLRLVPGVRDSKAHGRDRPPAAGRGRGLRGGRVRAQGGPPEHGPGAG